MNHLEKKSPQCKANMKSGQISIIPKPELRGFWGDSLTKPPFQVTSAEVVIICPDEIGLFYKRLVVDNTSPSCSPFAYSVGDTWNIFLEKMKEKLLAPPTAQGWNIDAFETTTSR